MEEVATHLGVTRKALLNWIKEYKQGGVDLLLSPAKRNRPSKLITPEIHEELEKRLLSEKNPFSSYVEVKEWLLKQYSVEIEYQWLWICRKMPFCGGYTPFGAISASFRQYISLGKFFSDNGRTVCVGN